MRLFNSHSVAVSCGRRSQSTGTRSDASVRRYGALPQRFDILLTPTSAICPSETSSEYSMLREDRPGRLRPPLHHAGQRNRLLKLSLPAEFAQARPEGIRPTLGAVWHHTL